VRELKAFRKLGLDAGQSAEAGFTLTREDLAFVHADLQRTSDPGVFDLWVGPSSTEGFGKTFRLSAS
jgi:beta-glucosidase